MYEKRKNISDNLYGRTKKKGKKSSPQDLGIVILSVIIEALLLLLLGIFLLYFGILIFKIKAQYKYFCSSIYKIIFYEKSPSSSILDSIGFYLLHKKSWYSIKALFSWFNTIWIDKNADLCNLVLQYNLVV